MLGTCKHCKEKDEYIALLKKMLRGIVSAHNKRNPALITMALVLCEHIRLVPKGSVDHRNLPPWWDAEKAGEAWLSRLPPNRLHFFCQGMVVGYFLHECYPASEGVYTYMAYRGPGHFEMALRCDEHGEAPCYHLGTDPPTHFVARSTKEFGELAISDFTQSPLPEYFKPAIDDLPFAEEIELKEAGDEQ